MERYRCTPYTIKTTGTRFYITANSDEDAIAQAKERAAKESSYCDSVIVQNDRDVEIADVEIHR